MEARIKKGTSAKVRSKERAFVVWYDVWSKKTLKIR
jgi:hypothetical protein